MSAGKRPDEQGRGRRSDTPREHMQRDDSEVLARLTDPNSYTGTHKQKFEERGRVQIREDRSDPSRRDPSTGSRKDKDGPSIFDKLTDFRLFTGIHRYKFDSEGRGLGSSDVIGVVGLEDILRKPDLPAQSPGNAGNAAIYDRLSEARYTVPLSDKEGRSMYRSSSFRAPRSQTPTRRRHTMSPSLSQGAQDDSDVMEPRESVTTATTSLHQLRSLSAQVKRLERQVKENEATIKKLQQERDALKKALDKEKDENRERMSQVRQEYEDKMSGRGAVDTADEELLQARDMIDQLQQEREQFEIEREQERTETEGVIEDLKRKLAAKGESSKKKSMQEDDSESEEEAEGGKKGNGESGGKEEELRKELALRSEKLANMHRELSQLKKRQKDLEHFERGKQGLMKELAELTRDNAELTRKAKGLETLLARRDKEKERDGGGSGSPAPSDWSKEKSDLLREKTELSHTKTELTRKLQATETLRLQEQERMKRLEELLPKMKKQIESYKELESNFITSQKQWDTQKTQLERDLKVARESGPAISAAPSPSLARKPNADSAQLLAQREALARELEKEREKAEDLQRQYEKDTQALRSQLVEQGSDSAEELRAEIDDLRKQLESEKEGHSSDAQTWEEDREKLRAELENQKSLNSKAAEGAAETTKLHSEKEKWQTQAQQLATDLKIAQATRKSGEEAAKKLHDAEKEKLVKEIESLKAEITAKESSVQLEKERALKEIDSIRSMAQSEAGSVATVKEENERLRIANQSLQRELYAVQAERESTLKEVDSNTRKDAEIADLTSRLEGMGKGLEEVDSLRSSLAEAQKKSQEREQASRDEIKKARSEMETAMAQSMAEVNARLSAVQTEKESQQREVLSLQEQLSKSSVAPPATASQADTETLRREVKEARTSLSQSERLLSDLRAENERLTGEISKSRGSSSLSVSTLQSTWLAEKHELQEEIERIKEEAENTENTLRDVETEKEALEKEIYQLKQASSVSPAPTTSQTPAPLAEVQHELESANASMQKMNEENLRLREAARQERESMEKQISSLNLQAAKDAETARSLESRLKDISRQQEASEQNVKSVSAALERETKAREEAEKARSQPTTTAGSAEDLQKALSELAEEREKSKKTLEEAARMQREAEEVKKKAKETEDASGKWMLQFAKAKKEVLDLKTAAERAEKLVGEKTRECEVAEAEAQIERERADKAVRDLVALRLELERRSPASLSLNSSSSSSVSLLSPSSPVPPSHSEKEGFNAGAQLAPREQEEF